jgi:hypothetical protein
MTLSKREAEYRRGRKLLSFIYDDGAQLGAQLLLDLYRSGYRKAGWELADWHHSRIQTGLSDAEVVSLKIEDIVKNHSSAAALDLYYYKWDEKFPDLLPQHRMRELLELVRENSAEIDEILSRGEFG